MNDSAPPFPDARSDAKRQRAKDRLYVICQTVCWGGFLAMQLAVTTMVASARDHAISLSDYLNMALVVLLGLIVSHFVRIYIHRWGLKEMPWIKMLPRGLGLAALMSVVWSVAGYGWIYGVLREPWPDSINPFLLLVVSIINGTIVYAAWLSAYFIYHVYSRYNQSEIERLRLSSVVKEAELRALKSQVNPHFMFNSLNSVRALIDEDPQRAREAVTQLANMLRYSLQAGRKQTVSFEEELTVVNDYLALEQVRHEERLRLRLDVAPETLQREVPPMLLQTLVENAVKYGIAELPSGGEIAIIARVVEDELHIAVQNPGQLRASRPGRTAQRSTGVGLRNASERLQLLFGDTARLSVEQSSAETVTASVVVPQDPERPAAPPARRRAVSPVRSSTADSVSA